MGAMHRTCLLLLGLSLAACGASPSAAATGGGRDGSTGEATGGDEATRDGGSADGDGEVGGLDDTSALLVDMVAPHLCEQLRSSFVGLPGEGGHEGPASGTDPTVGRWWIRECTASVRGDMLS
ncbi:MAG: hypothetical protein EBZ59_13250, partial [Planctomycetia bacterium]|nr:hypothetical protein [Planctomycetia bacterium]